VCEICRLSYRFIEEATAGYCARCVMEHGKNVGKVLILVRALREALKHPMHPNYCKMDLHNPEGCNCWIRSGSLALKSVQHNP